MMAAWLKTVSHLNPLTYVMDALRSSMLAGGSSVFGLGMYYAVILGTAIVLVMVGARLYLRLAIQAVCENLRYRWCIQDWVGRRFVSPLRGSTKLGDLGDAVPWVGTHGYGSVSATRFRRGIQLSG